MKTELTFVPGITILLITINQPYAKARHRNLKGDGGSQNKFPVKMGVRTTAK